jgi:hypothetical protein
VTRNPPQARPREAPPDRGSVLAAAGAWLLGAVLLGVSGWLPTLRPPAPQLLLVGITTALLVAGRSWPPLRQLVRIADLRALVSVHLTRFVGFYFLALHARGALPWAFAVPGGWGDVVVASAALLLVLLVRPDTPPGRRAYLVWNVLGLLDIVGVVLTAARLAFQDPASMSALLELPLSLLLTLIVPLIVATHVWMLGRLAPGSAERQT